MIELAAVAGGVVGVGTSGLLAVLLLISLWNALRAPRLRAPVTNARARPSLTAVLLVPARNEAPHLAATLQAAAQHSPGTAVQVLDDESTDMTAAIVRRFERATGGAVRLAEGTPLPEGWLGKNWACHQLGSMADADVLVFCDADVTLTGDAVRATLDLMERTGADVVTALPRQRYAGGWDRATIPLLLHFPLLATLPLALVGCTRSPALVFGNGQWLAFRRDAYDAIGGHAAVRGDVVEDMALVRRAKQHGLRVVPALAPALLDVRMYRDHAAMFTGFGRNIYPLLGASPLNAGLALLLFLAATALPFVLALAGALLPLALLLALRLLHARMTGAALDTVLLHPLGVALAGAVVLRSTFDHYSGSVTWKARDISSSRTAPAST